MEDLTQDQEDLLDLFFYINLFAWNIMNAQEKINSKKYKNLDREMTNIKNNFMYMTESKDFKNIIKELKKLDPDIIRSMYNSFKNHEINLDLSIGCEGLETEQPRPKSA